MLQRGLKSKTQEQKPRNKSDYQALGVPEVWFWEDGFFNLYCLRSDGYEQVSKSELLPNLDIDLLMRYLLVASQLEAVREFQRRINL